MRSGPTSRRPEIPVARVLKARRLPIAARLPSCRRLGPGLSRLGRGRWERAPSRRTGARTRRRAGRAPSAPRPGCVRGRWPRKYLIGSPAPPRSPAPEALPRRAPRRVRSRNSHRQSPAEGRVPPPPAAGVVGGGRTSAFGSATYRAGRGRPHPASSVPRRRRTRQRIRSDERVLCAAPSTRPGPDRRVRSASPSRRSACAPGQSTVCAARFLKSRARRLGARGRAGRRAGGPSSGSKSNTPSAYTSVAVVGSSPWICSGDA